jgi:hypothetical protein
MWGDMAQTMAANNLANYHPPQIDVASIASTPPGYLAQGPLPTPPSQSGGGGGGGNNGNGNNQGTLNKTLQDLLSQLETGGSSTSTDTSNLGPVLGSTGKPINGTVTMRRGGAVGRALRLARAKGGRAGYDDGGRTGDGDVTTADIMQNYKPPTFGGRIWNWLTSEHPPEAPKRALTPREQAALGTASDVMGAKSLGEALRVPSPNAISLSEMSGVPAALRTKDALQEGRYWDAAEDVAPFVAGPLARPVYRGIGALSAIPKSVTYPALGAAGLLAGTTAAGEAEPNLAPQEHGTGASGSWGPPGTGSSRAITPAQAALKKLEDQRAEAQQHIDSIMARPMPEKKYSRWLEPEQLKVRQDADLAAHRQALEGQTRGYQKIVDDLGPQIIKAQEAVNEEAQGELPFRQRHPDITRALQVTGEALPALVAWRMGRTNKANVDTALSAYDAAVAAGDHVAEQRAREQLRSLIGHGGFGGWARKELPNVAQGVGLSTLFNTFPELNDLSGAGPAKEKAWETFQDPKYWMTRGALIGAGGVFAPIVGNAVGKVLPGAANRDRARAVLSSSTLPPRPQPPPPGPRPLGPTEWSQTERDLARQAMAAKTPNVQNVSTADIMDALRKGNIDPSAASANIGTRLQNTQQELTELAKQKRRPIRPADVFNMEKTGQFPSTKGKRMLSVTPLAPAIVGSIDSSPYTGPSQERKQQSGSSQRERSSSPPEEARGGYIDNRRHRASGGAVHAGPIQHVADGGRTDTAPLDVASGSYVIPADVISSLGQGDTAAGYRVVNHMFGPQQPSQGNPPGGRVPIMAAGGEYIVSPDAVAKVGQGDIRAGHDALDHWVKIQRRKTIMALKRLPGPARD